MGPSTILCDGRGGISAYISPRQDTRCGIGDCVREHEMSHRADALRANRSICRNADGRPYPLFTQVWNTGAAERIATEMRAYNVQLACLENKLAAEACEGPCRDLLYDEIRGVEYRLLHREFDHPLPRNY